MYVAVSEDFHSVQTQLRKIEPRPKGNEGYSRSLSVGQHLFYETDPANFVYRVRSGVLRLTRIQKDGRRQIIAFGFPGDIIGLPCDGRHTTECDAITPAEVVARRYDSEGRPGHESGLRSLLMASALDEIRMLQEHFLMLGLRLASEKVAAFLSLLLSKIGEPIGEYHLIRLPMNRSDIADYLGLTPETVSRSMTQLRSDNVIALDDANTIIVRDADRLRGLSEGEFSQRAACA